MTLSPSCARMRRAGSAVLDGEADRDQARRWLQHAQACPGCSAWAAAAERLRADLQRPPRPGRRRPATAPVPTAAGSRWPSHVLRAALAAIALVQLVTAALGLLAPSHDGRESGAADIAVAVGVLVVAWRPSRAAGLAPVLGCFALLLVGTAAADVLRGEVHLAHEIRHVLVVVAALLVAALRRQPIPPARRGPGQRQARVEGAA